MGEAAAAQSSALPTALAETVRDAAVEGGEPAAPKNAGKTALADPLHLLLLPAGNIALHALYSPSLSGVSLMAGAAVMGLTFAVPYQASVGRRCCQAAR